MRPLIIIEGPDGAGKTTLIEQLTNRMLDLGYDVNRSSQPGATQLGSDLRKMLLDPEQDYSPLTQTLLFYASRQEFIDKVFNKRKQNSIYLTDRFELSTLAYQKATFEMDLLYTNDVSAENKALEFHVKLSELNRTLMTSIPRKYLITMAPNEMCMKRMTGNDYFEKKGGAFFDRIYAYYQKYLQENRGKMNVRMVNTSSPIEQEQLDNIIKWILVK